MQLDLRLVEEEEIAPQELELPTIRAKVFNTIQGEGPLTGTPAIFVRFQGCPLKCIFCDETVNHSDPREGPYTTFKNVYELIDHIQLVKGNNSLIVLTGGEPLLQGTVLEILASHLFRNCRLRMQLETSGHVGSSSLLHQLPPALAGIVISPKTAKVAESWLESCWWNDVVSWKYVIPALGELGRDGLPNISTQDGVTPVHIQRPPHWIKKTQILVQPMFYRNDKESTKIATQRCVELALRHGYRLSLQTHRYINVP